MIKSINVMVSCIYGSSYVDTVIFRWLESTVTLISILYKFPFLMVLMLLYQKYLFVYIKACIQLNWQLYLLFSLDNFYFKLLLWYCKILAISNDNFTSNLNCHFIGKKNIARFVCPDMASHLMLLVSLWYFCLDFKTYVILYVKQWY